MGNLSESEHNLVGLAIVIIGTLGLLINKSLFSKNSKLSEPNNLILHLVLNNFGLIIVCFPFPVISSFKHEWAFSSGACTFYGSSSLVFGYNIMLSVVMICLEYLFEKAYADYGSWKHQVRNVMIGYMWVNSVFFGLAPVFGWSRIGQELTLTSCTVDFVNADDAYRTYIISAFVLMFAGPIITMFYCASSMSESKHSEKYASNDKKILVQLLWFIFAWTPYAICYMWPLFGDINNLNIRFNALAPVIAKLSVLTTPLLLISNMDSIVKKSEKKVEKSQ